jgi:6-phosphogluconolactonase
MRKQVLPDAEAVAAQAAEIIAEAARAAIGARGQFILAVSGGKTPWRMMRLLGTKDLPWPAVHIIQVDERVAPAGHPDRNSTQLQEILLTHAPLRPTQIHLMPVESEELEIGAREYEALLNKLAGTPPVLDLVHLGLGADGHTASLVPDDPVLEIKDSAVAVTGTYQGRRRMTLTFLVINQARQILWIVTGPEKAPMLARLLKQDPEIPAGRVNPERAIVLADEAAAAHQQT